MPNDAITRVNVNRHADWAGTADATCELKRQETVGMAWGPETQGKVVAMMLTRLSLTLLAGLLAAGCTVSFPHHFTSPGEFSFLDAGLHPIPATGRLVATPLPE